LSCYARWGLWECMLLDGDEGYDRDGRDEEVLYRVYCDGGDVV